MTTVTRTIIALAMLVAVGLWSCVSSPEPRTTVADETVVPPELTALERFSFHAEAGNFALALAEFDEARDLTDPANLLEFDLAAASMAMVLGDFNAARSMLAPWDPASEKNRDLWFALSTIEAAAGNFPGQEDYLRALVAVFPQDADALAGLGLAAYARGDNNGALTLFGRVLQANPRQTTALQFRAEIYAGRENYPSALADLNLLLELEPNLDTAWSLRGRIYDMTGKGQESIADLSRAVELGPDNAWNWWDRGRVYFRRGNFEKALPDLEAVLRLEPDNVIAEGYRAESLTQVGRVEDSADAYQALLDKRPDYYPAYELAAAAFYKVGLYAAAQRYFVAAGGTRTGRPAHFLLAALANLEGGRTAEARQVLEARMASFGSTVWSSVARFLLGNLPESAMLTALGQPGLPAFDKQSASVLAGIRFRQLGKTATSLALLTEMGEDILRGTPEGSLAQWLTSNER